MSDEEILNILTCNSNSFNSHLSKHLKNEQIKNYLLNRYPDSDSLLECAYRLLYHIEIRPTCSICGGRLLFVNNKHGLYSKTCDNKNCKKQHCVNKLRQTKLEKYGEEKFINVSKIKQTKLERYGNENYTNKEKAFNTNIERYGTAYPFLLDKSKETKITKYGDANYNNRTKMKQTKFERYGDENFVNVEKCKQTKFERYGDETFVNPDKAKKTKLERYGNETFVNPVKAKQTKQDKYGDENYRDIDKMKQTKLEKYGDSNYVNSDKARETRLQKYGDENFNNRELAKQTTIERYGCENFTQTSYWQNIIQNKEWQQHRKEEEYKTKKKNHTFNSSHIEEDTFNKLKEIFPLIKQHYKSEKYPFVCDFYIPEIDTYIECNFHWTHGGHFFDINNEKDITILNSWKNKHTKFYNNAINTWTIRDLNKQNIAYKNKLNYVVFWTANDVNNWINDIKNE